MRLDVRSLGAVGDGKHNDTGVFRDALARLRASEGGTLEIPPGTYVCGTLRIPSATTVCLYPGAMLLASPDIEDFEQFDPPPGKPRKPGQKVRHFIWCEDAENVVIEGGGIIHGNVEAYAAKPKSERPPYTWWGRGRESPTPLLGFRHVRNMVIRDVELREASGWTLHIQECDQVRIHDIRIWNDPYAGNSDGIDLDACRDVSIRGCHIDTGDDAIVLKTLRGTRSCERVTVSDCILKSTCAAFKIGTESHHDFRHIVFTNSVVHRSNRAFQMVNLDGCIMEDIVVSNLVVDDNAGVNMSRPLHLDVRERVPLDTNPIDWDPLPAGIIRRVRIENITLRTDGRVLMTSADGGRMEQISLRGLTLDYLWIQDPKDVLDLSCRLQSSNHSPEARAARAAIVADGVKDLHVSEIQISWPGDLLPKDYIAVPKYEKGQLVRDPNIDFAPIPPFYVVWTHNVEHARIDTEGLAPYPGLTTTSLST